MKQMLFDKDNGLPNNEAKMKRLRSNQDGFITMIVVLIAILVAAIVFVYSRVRDAQ